MDALVKSASVGVCPTKTVEMSPPSWCLTQPLNFRRDQVANPPRLWYQTSLSTPAKPGRAGSAEDRRTERVTEVAFQSCAKPARTSRHRGWELLN